MRSHDSRAPMVDNVQHTEGLFSKAQGMLHHAYASSNTVPMDAVTHAELKAAIQHGLDLLTGPLSVWKLPEHSDGFTDKSVFTLSATGLRETHTTTRRLRITVYHLKGGGFSVVMDGFRAGEGKHHASIPPVTIRAAAGLMNLIGDNVATRKLMLDLAHDTSHEKKTATARALREYQPKAPPLAIENGPYTQSSFRSSPTQSMSQYGNPDTNWGGADVYSDDANHHQTVKSVPTFGHSRAYQGAPPPVVVSSPHEGTVFHGDWGSPSLATYHGPSRLDPTDIPASVRTVAAYANARRARGAT